MSAQIVALKVPAPAPSPSPDPIDVALGASLRQLRLARKTSLAELARHLGLTYQQIQKYERGRNRMVASTLFRIADYFGVGLDDLFSPLNGMKQRTAEEKIVIIPLPRAAALQNADEEELASVMAAYAAIANPTVRDGVKQLIERLANERSV